MRAREMLVTIAKEEVLKRRAAILKDQKVLGVWEGRLALVSTQLDTMKDELEHRA
ncbi:hypothetical protein LINGRAHAP2_LOCUS6762, partial [Linum grandiflorum]